MNQLPMFTPDSPWKIPTELPDLRGRPLVAIDTEERDDGLAKERGPGWAYRAGKIIGVSWATEVPGEQGYAPIDHPDTPGCFPKENVSRWMQDLVKSRTPLVFQNAPYDLGWLWADLDVDIPPEYPIEDTLAAAFMCDEDQYEYNLDAICERLGMEGKDEKLMMEAGSAYLRPANALKSWKLTRKALKANLYRLPARYVGHYAEIDARRTIDAFKLMLPIMEKERTLRAYRLEMDLVPTVRIMRSRGIKIDPKVYEYQRQVRDERDAKLKEIKSRLPGRGDVEMEHLRSNKWLDPLFADEGIRVPRTEATDAHKDGQSSYKQKWMEKSEHWLPKLVSRALALDRFAETFLGEFIIGYMHKGRIHAEIHQYKSDDGGTVSYRFAYSNPPLQQAPSPDRDPVLGKAFRECLIADGIWGSNDYSQQEYRLTAHFAALCKVRGGQDAADKYIADPNLDFHKMVGEMSGLGRPKAKILNFALLYGQGVGSTAAALNCTEEEAKELRGQVSDNAPFGPALDDYCKTEAKKKGYLVLIDGARVRFNDWEAGFISREEYGRGIRERRAMNPCSLKEAQDRRDDPDHPWFRSNLRRAGVRKALNRLIQGSAARQTKLAMRECAREKLYPIMQMHDELNHDEDSPEKIKRVADIMRDIVKLRVPMKVDSGFGRSWAEAKMKDAAPKPQGVDLSHRDPPNKPRTAKAGHALDALIQRDK